MKKLLPIMLLVCLVVASLVGATVVATAQDATTPQASNKIIHLINPTALVTLGNYLYVADNVVSGQTILLCFEIQNDQPVYKMSYSIQGDVVNLATGNGKLFAITATNVLEYNVANGELPNLSQTYDVASVVDAAYGDSLGLLVASSQEGNRILHTEEQLFDTFESLPNSSTPKGLLAIGNYNYYLVDNTCGRYRASWSPITNDTFNSNIDLEGLNPMGLFLWGEELGFFEQNSLWRVKTDITSKTKPAVLASGLNYDIKDVASYANGATKRLYVLNDDNKIDVYGASGETLSATPITTIGSETVVGTVPTEFTSYTLAKPVGYPTNIVYMTEDGATSIDKIKIRYDGDYIILGYDGDQQNDYYYVLVGNKFGWVKRSDGATTPQNDPNLTIKDTSVSGDFSYTTKFNSLNAVFVYDLPFADAATTTHNQTASNQKVLTVLQRFVEKTDTGSTTWYYVTFEGGEGFVQRDKIGDFHATKTNNNVLVQVGDRKINSSLFKAVTLHMTQDLAEDEIVVDTQGEQVKLYSGDRVTVIRQNDQASFVQVQHNDGSFDFGWVPTQNLIKLNGITTNAIVGLVFLFVAIGLGVALLVIFRNHKKGKRS